MVARRSVGSARPVIYCAANWVRTSLHAGEREAALVARHCTMRPPPGATLPHSARTSPPHADLKTNSSSRGRIGRSTSTGAGAAAAPGLAVAAAAGTAPAAGVAVPPPAALTACWQLPESFDLFFSKQFSAAAPPVGTPAQVF